MSKRLVEDVRRERFKQLVDEIGGTAKMAERLEKSSSYVSQLVSGHRNIGRNAAKGIEDTLGLEPNYLDQAEEFGLGIVEESISDYQATHAGMDQLVSIPSYRSQVDAGKGQHRDDVVSVPGGLVFKRASLKKAGLLNQQLSCIFASGHSMEPTIADADLLLLNHGHTRIDNGAIYAIRWGVELRCKRLFWTADQRLLVRSDNPDKSRYPDETVAGDQDGLEIIAHVCWRGGWI